jgi:hypothetical protein
MLVAKRWSELMLHVFGFEKVGVAVGDLYFVDPQPAVGQEGAERGVRLEVRLLASFPTEGSVYSARPILVDRPIWRADLLESVAGGPGTWDRTHHHPMMRGWEPGSRQFDKAMSTDPLGFVAEQLSDLKALMESAGVDPDETTDQDAAELRAAVPQILETVRSLLTQVRDGHLAKEPAGLERADTVRTGWL